MKLECVYTYLNVRGGVPGLYSARHYSKDLSYWQISSFIRHEPVFSNVILSVEDTRALNTKQNNIKSKKSHFAIFGIC